MPFATTVLCHSCLLDSDSMPASMKELRARDTAAKSLPFVPVTELMVRGRVRMSMMLGVWSHGTRKWVPSPTG